jgi:triacylglycerol esterase/lipase EstA (alpha/beta hydrolase family)
MRIFKIFLIIFLIFAPKNSYAEQKEIVVVLHGIFHTSWLMQPMADYLEKQGYEVLNLDYPSTKYSIEDLVELTATDIDSRISDKTRTVNFIGFSMGGLLVRGIIAKHRPENLGRVVLLGTPNKGSEVADFLRNNYLYKTFFGPAGQQLCVQNYLELEPLFGKIDYDLGVIAGNSTIDPISSYIIPDDDDGKVSIESTKLEGMKDHIIISADHILMPGNKEVQRQTLEFLKNGFFKK